MPTMDEIELTRLECELRELRRLMNARIEKMERRIKKLKSNAKEKSTARAD